MKILHSIKNTHITYTLLLFSVLPNQLFSNDTIQYKFFVGISEPDTQWKDTDFNDSLWLPGRGSIGYGDDDDSIVIEPTASLYIRYYLDSISYFPADMNRITGMVLNVDYDDGFIAYLNGAEVLRINIDKDIHNPDHNQLTYRSHEAENYRTKYPLKNFGFFIDSSVFHSCNMGIGSILSFQVHNDSVNGSDLSFHVRPEFIYDTADGSMGDGTSYGMWFTYIAQVDIDSSELPIVVIETDEFGFGDIVNPQNINAFMGIINNDDKYNKTSDPYNAYQGRIRTKIRGGLSKMPPKKSFSLETQDSLGENNNVALLGMPQENDWVLYGPYIDKSLIRDELVFRLGRKLGYYEPRTRFCELILNGQNRGLYIMTEKIKKDKNRIDIATLKPDENNYPDISGGYLFEAGGDGSLEIKYPDDSKITASQSDYIWAYFDSAKAAISGRNFKDPVLGFRKFIDTKSLIDYMLITELSNNFDGYSRSVYVYKDKDPNGGKLHFGTWWDYDYSFLDREFISGSDEWRFEYGENLKISRYLQDPGFANEFVSRWQELRKGPYHTDSIAWLIDEIIKPIKPYIERNYKVWPSIEKPILSFIIVGKTYEEEISILKSWITTRASWIDNNIVLLKKNVSINDNHRDFSDIENSLRCFPNPFNVKLQVNMNVASSGNLKICLFDLSGRNVYSYYKKQIQAGENNMELVPDDNLVPGIYILKAWIGKTQFWEQKVIKVNNEFVR